MIYNPACAHCRQKLGQGLRNSYLEKSTGTGSSQERRRSMPSSCTTSVSHHDHVHSQQPWLNEKVLRAFDEPAQPSQILPEQNICPPMRSFCTSPLPLTPNEGFEEMLKTLGNAMQPREPGTAQAANMFPDPRSRHRANPGLEPDILSPTARAQLQLMSEMEHFNCPEDCWTHPAPSSTPYRSTMSDYSMSPPSAPSLSAPSFSISSFQSSDNRSYNPSPPFHDPLFDILDDHMSDLFLSGQSPPSFPIPNSHRRDRTRRHSNPPRRQQNRTFKFIIEDPVGEHRHIAKRKS